MRFSRTGPDSEHWRDRPRPAADQAEAGNVKLVVGPWNDAFLDELGVFPHGQHDDQVDAFSGALNQLAAGRSILVA